jgi:hypothetical protein
MAERRFLPQTNTEFDGKGEISLDYDWATEQQVALEGI